MAEVRVIGSTESARVAAKLLMLGAASAEVAVSEFNNVVSLRAPNSGCWVQKYIVPVKKGKGPRDRWGRL